ncbi:Predicted NTPase (NACHT family) [Serratia quinivorans]|nr:Predicted NTPase (NACHT family) [Serratia quinivorans]VEI67947.1 Predicted NTPase (NACHT family) [Serratia quinivorans]
MGITGYLAGKLDKGVDKLIEDKSNALFDFILKNPWRYSSKKGEKLIRTLRQDANYKKFVEGHIYENLKTKTIDGRNSIFFIDEIYHPVNLTNSKSEKVNIENIIDVTDGKIVNIIGVAGQGKSTLMKKILFEIIRKGQRLPFFIELRNLENKTIIDKINEILLSFGVESENEIIESALSSSRLILLLDGFDEISFERRKLVYQEIENIKSKLKTPIIISSRPFTEICESTITLEVNIKDLNKKDIFEIIEKRMSNEEAEKAKEVLSSNETLLNSLITPILVSLFCACYPNSDIVPKTASDYYQRIFNILYEGHDLRKLFFSRQKEFPVTIDVAKSIFCAFSFLSLKDNKITMKKESALDFIDKSIRRCGLNPVENDTKNCLSDIIKITSLLKEDGFEQYAFIHKSIQEYHAALFIKESDERTKKSISESILNGLSEGKVKYHGVAKFLYSIDSINTIENISLPCFERLGFNATVDLDELANILLDSAINQSRAGIVNHMKENLRNKKKKEKMVSREIYILKAQTIYGEIFSLMPFLQNMKESELNFCEMAYAKLNEPHYMRYYLDKIGETSNDVPLDDSNSLTLRHIIDHFYLYDLLHTKAKESIKKMQEEYLSQKYRIGSINSTSGFFNDL